MLVSKSSCAGGEQCMQCSAGAEPSPCPGTEDISTAPEPLCRPGSLSAGGAELEVSETPLPCPQHGADPGSGLWPLPDTRTRAKPLPWGKGSQHSLPLGNGNASKEEMSEHKICQELVKDCPQPCQLLQHSARDGGGGVGGSWSSAGCRAGWGEG